MSFTILGMGSAVPITCCSQSQAVQVARAMTNATDAQARLLAQIFAKTGIRQRHIILDRAVIQDILEGTRQTQSIFLPEKQAGDHPGPTTGQRMREYMRHAGPLAQEACSLALNQAGLSARRITHLVTVSCTGFHAPGFDVELIGRLGLPATTQRTHVGFMGCHGALNGLRVAHGLTAANPNARVLLCAVELCSVHCVFRWDLEQMVASSLFSDGAAAMVGAAAGPERTWTLAASGSCVFPASTHAMSWSVDDHGFVMTLSREVPDLIQRCVPDWLGSWLAEQGLRIEDVRSWAIHPGGPKILEAVAQTLRLSPADLEPSRHILAEYGNMSSATMLFILERMIGQGAAGPCVSLAFGPGLTAEAALWHTP